MKLGVAGRIPIIDADLSDTQDVTPRYSDIVYLYQDGSHGADSVADMWLDHIGGE